MAGNVVTVSRETADRLSTKLYLPAVLSGLAITARHFFGNLFGYVRGKRRTFVVNWPEEKVPYAPAFRGMPVLVALEDGDPRCVACGLCEAACPTDCITIFPAETEDGIERIPDVFDIQLDRCMFCGLCEEACPEEAIVMSDRVEVSAFDRAGCVWHKEDLLVPAEDVETRLEFIRRGYDRKDVDE